MNVPIGFFSVSSISGMVGHGDDEQLGAWGVGSGGGDRRGVDADGCAAGAVDAGGTVPGEADG
jgi:hypothetical protein